MVMLQFKQHDDCIRQEMCAAFHGKHPADLLLVCNGNEILRAHKLVLAAASPLIRMLLADASTTMEDITTMHFPDIPAHAFRLLLHFLYSVGTCAPTHEVEKFHDLLELLQMRNLNKFDFKTSNIDINSNKRVDLNQSKCCVSSIPLAKRKRTLARDDEVVKKKFGDFVEISDTEESTQDPAKLELLEPKVFKALESKASFVPNLNLPVLEDHNSLQGAPTSQNDVAPSSNSDRVRYTSMYYKQQVDISESGSSNTQITLKHKCHYCDKSFPLKTNLIVHLSVHTEETPFACRLCFTRYKQRINLVKHLCFMHQNTINSWKDVDGFKCNFCSVRIQIKRELIRHISNNHSDILLNPNDQAHGGPISA